MIAYITLTLTLILLIITLILLFLKKKKIEREEEQELSNLLEEIDKNKQKLNEIRSDITGELNNAQNLKNTLEEKAKIEKERIFEQIKQDEEVAMTNLNNLNDEIRVLRLFYLSLTEPLKQLEKETKEKLFYTINLTEENKNDIIYLLREVAPKVNHKDIVSKLIWNEYLKNPLEETLKRVGVSSEPGIYKITNIETGKCYVGKSTNVKRRLQDHFKSVVGIQSISDQLIHREILKQGIDKWMIEQICVCEKEDLSNLERYYIAFFDSMNFGYNLTAGG